MLRNGAAHSHCEAIADRLVGLGLLQDADRGDQAVVDTALEALLDRFAAVPAGAPIIGPR
jgi:hypothetical protein